MKVDDDPEELGMTWESVLRDRGYSEEYILERRNRRALKEAADELHSTG